MKPTEIKTGTRIKSKGFDISIGKELHQIALISHSTDEFTPFASIKKGGRLAKIKRKFKSRLCSSTHFFFNFMTEQETLSLIEELKK